MKTRTEELWQTIAREAAGVRYEGLLIRRILPGLRSDLFLGLQEPGDRRVFMLQVKRDALPDVAALPETRGLDISITAIPGEGDGRGCLTLELREERFADLFDVLVADTAGAVGAAESDTEAVNAFLGRLRRWQRFLEVASGEGLGEEAQRGLYGELWFLLRRVLPVTGPAGIRFWTGWQGAPQDFTMPGGAIEVKCSRCDVRPCVLVHGADQLDESIAGSLYLSHVTVACRPAGETLVQTVNALRSELSIDPVSAEAFETALLEAGYHDRHESRYSSILYEVRDDALYKIDGSFPRIRQCDLAAGVEDVCYRVDLAACTVHRVSKESAVSLLMAA